jgi:predicted branched-subunit amino acid permease
MNDSKLKDNLSKIFPVALALLPIGFLFGLLAGQAHWSALDVFLISSLGFTGSGQFTFLSLSTNPLSSTDIFFAFLIILSLNLRYVPMSLSASRDIKTSFGIRMGLAHLLADESYALEQPKDTLKDKTLIRLCIFGVWVGSTVIGVLAADLIPSTIQDQLSGFTFPISAILFALALINIFSFLQQYPHAFKWLSVVICFIASFACLYFLGTRYFWIPSIAMCFALLTYLNRHQDND